MTEDIVYYVDCIRDGKVFKTYDFLAPASLSAPPAQLDDETLKRLAMEALSTEGLAQPPFDGLTFRINRRKAASPNRANFSSPKARSDRKADSRRE